MNSVLYLSNVHCAIQSINTLHCQQGQVKNGEANGINERVTLRLALRWDSSRYLVLTVAAAFSNAVFYGYLREVTVEFDVWSSVEVLTNHESIPITIHLMELQEFKLYTEC